ncbi:unnamed protein product [Staurois parvus]|uniref:HMG box domain-containing protein n=1 Tax=Staurois parvus TaxID=386267 RepID=A0ABN9GE23_9NEOB|nr:unnamed protein product [Staurois parvus]
MVSLLSRGVGVLVKSLVGLSCAQAGRCSSLPSALSAVQCTTARWFSKNPVLPDLPKAPLKEPPKAPLSSFFRFLRHQRPLLSRKYPEASVTELVKIIGSEWRALPEAEKQVYVDAARVDIMKYRELYKHYKESLDPLDLSVLQQQRKKKLERRKLKRQKMEHKLFGRPKRNLSAFNMFMTEHYSETEGNTMFEKGRNLRHQWENIPSSKKQVYVQLAEDDKVRYQNELKAWEEQMIEIGREDLVRKKEKKRLLNKRFAEVNTKPGKRVKKKSSQHKNREE